MANTYRKMYLHLVFAVKNRKALLDQSWRHDVFRYIAGIINKRNHYSLAVNGANDHIHIFIDYNGQELISDLVREIKKASNYLIKEKGWCKQKFEWQSGYGVFSYSYLEKDGMIQYIMNQSEHHRTRSFQEEYLNLLKSLTKTVHTTIYKDLKNLKRFPMSLELVIISIIGLQMVFSR